MPYVHLKEVRKEKFVLIFDKAWYINVSMQGSHHFYFYYNQTILTYSCFFFLDQNSCETTLWIKANLTPSNSKSRRLHTWKKFDSALEEEEEYNPKKDSSVHRSVMCVLEKNDEQPRQE